MRTLRLDLEYDGTAYQGWGIQPAAPTVQGMLEAALGEALGHPVRATAGGRTDTGVHAVGQVVSLTTESRLPTGAVARAANARLPADIRVLQAVEAPPAFHARYSALWRSYRYTLWRDEQPNIWWRRYSHHVPGPLDLAAMRRASRRLCGSRDFSALATHQTQANRPDRTRRTVFRAAWRVEGLFWHFDIVADAFLRHMVRTMVGTLLLVGRGRLTPAAVSEILRGGDRRLAGPTAPAAGLTLMHIAYGDDRGGYGREETAGEHLHPQEG